MPSSTQRALALSGALLLCVALAVPGSARARRERVTTIAPGVTLTVIRDYSGPFRIRVLTVDRTSGATIDTVLANDKLPKFETTSSMARRNGALAAVNGDYALPEGRPVYTFAADGHLAQTPLGWGRNFAVRQDKTAAYIGHPEVVASVTEHDSGTTYPVPRVNQGPPSTDEMTAFTKEGGRAERAPAGHCLARLQPSGPPRLMSDGSAGTEVPLYVELVQCGGSALRAKGGIVLATPMDGQYALSLSMLTPGEAMTFSWSTGWPGVLDTVGGNPTLVEAGQIPAQNIYGSGAFFRRHPRTGVGTTPDGQILLIAVDGRQPKYSVGMTLEEFSDLFISLGADYALNLDGGGSTTMVVNGDIKNRPSDGSERGVSSAITILPAGDYGEALPAPEPSTGDVPVVGDVWAEISSDPGSTGGLASYLKSRGKRLPAVLERAVAEFRSSRSRSKRPGFNRP